MNCSKGAPLGDVYKFAEKLSDLIWYTFDEWSKKVQNTIGYQIIRSTDSIASNIVEWYGRYAPADRRNFYRYVRGSFLAKGVPMGDKLGPKLNAFITSTK